MVEAVRPLLVFHGGTFDPVHCGHLAIAEAARDRLGTTVQLLPSADPPHRAPTGADATHRAAMLALAVDGRAGLEVDSRELDRGVPTRTIDTLRSVRRESGDDLPIAFVVGADSFRGLPGWKGWPGLLDEAHWVVAGRAGHPVDASLPPGLAAMVEHRWTEDADALRATRGGCLLRLDQPLHGASASQVRALVAAGGPWRTLVPAAVAAYIDHHRLYMDPGAGSL
ncbi:MAG TPA: nicotinate-nucleotide adenylyltransferase [Xanthomonadaceae bacterium]|nr:nicotinate-nucleotide adenylyltransferase [Xanthomonadaceae bacterium]